MNRILAYTVVAILLGTVTMVVPLALLGTGDSTRNHVLESGGETPERNDMLTTPEPPANQSADTESYDYPVKPSAAESTLREADVASNLSSIGLITVPSFLVALGVFVYLRKRTM